MSKKLDKLILVQLQGFKRTRRRKKKKKAYSTLSLY